MPFNQKDGKSEWIPTKKQEEFIQLPFDVFEALYGGAAGGGKSELAIVLPILYQFHENPRFNGLITRRTFPELQKSIIPRSFEYYLPFNAKYNEQKKVWTFPSGAKIFFGHLEAEKDVYQYQSAEFQYFAPDELTHYTEFQYTYLLSRVRGGGTIPKIVRAFSNPGNVGHAWVRKRFIDPAPEGRRLIEDRKSKTFRMFIQALAKDNPYLLNDDPGYYDRLRLLPVAEQKALIEGDWYSFSGQVFTEFRAHQLPDEPQNALHVIDPIFIPQWWPKILGADWGYRARTWVGWIAVSPDARHYLYREYVCEKTQIARWGSDIACLSQYDGNIKRHYLDPSAWKEEGHPQNIAQQLSTVTNWNWEKANNDRLGGKLLLHELLRWESRNPSFLPPSNFDGELEGKILRFHGTEAAESYRRMFDPQAEETNLPRLQIFNTCPEIIEAIQLCIYNETGRGKRAEDVAEFEGDDPYDGLRYLITGSDLYVSESSEEFSRRSRLAKILPVAKEDMTKFYRMMEAYEEEINEERADMVASPRMMTRARKEGLVH